MRQNIRKLKKRHIAVKKKTFSKTLNPSDHQQAFMIHKFDYDELNCLHNPWKTGFEIRTYVLTWSVTIHGAALE